MIRIFRKYHRFLAIAVSLTLILTVLTGMGYTIFDEWFHQERFAHFLMKIHTMKILGLDEIYPVLNGLGLVGLLVTGLTMTGLFKKRSSVH
ncbi:MAG: peptidase [Crocosphaera sp.]|nr:peptidase [Crocosphaera sp.]